MTNTETLQEETVHYLIKDEELFRIASLCGCGTTVAEEVRYRVKLAEYIAGLLVSLPETPTKENQHG